MNGDPTTWRWIQRTDPPYGTANSWFDHPPPFLERLSGSCRVTAVKWIPGPLIRQGGKTTSDPLRPSVRSGAT